MAVRITYDIDDQQAVDLKAFAQAHGLGVDSLTRVVMQKFIHAGEEFAARFITDDVALVEPEQVPYHSLSGAEDLDFCDEPLPSLAMNRHLAEIIKSAE